MDLDIYKQVIAFLLTTRGIPQLYYGTEILMYGDKADGDGLLRKDFPGGWQADERNAFTEAGRTAIENEAWNYTRNLLQWRKANAVIAQGKLKHFVPQQGVYVYERKLGKKSVVVMINGSSKELDLALGSFQEVLSQAQAYDVISGRYIALNNTLSFAGRQVYILEFNN